MTNVEVGRFGLGAAELELIQGVIGRHPPVIEALIFGSRAMGTYRPESDVDLVLLGEVDVHLAARIADELEDLPLPYHFDVQAYATVKHVPLRQHIDRVGQRVFAREEGDNEGVQQQS